MLILALITEVTGLPMMPETGAGLHTVMQAGFPFGHQLLAMKLRADLLSFFRWRRWRRSGRSLAGCLFADTVIHMNSAARLVCHGITFWWLVEVLSEEQQGAEQVAWAYLSAHHLACVVGATYLFPRRFRILFFRRLRGRRWWYWRTDVSWCRRINIHSLITSSLFEHVVLRSILVCHFRPPILEIRQGIHRCLQSNNFQCQACLPTHSVRSSSLAA